MKGLKSVAAKEPTVPMPLLHHNHRRVKNEGMDLTSRSKDTTAKYLKGSPMQSNSRIC